MTAAMNATNAKLQARYLRALKQVTEAHIAPQVSRYCMTTWGGETPWSAANTDGLQGRLLVELLELLVEKRFLAPPFCNNEQLTIRTVGCLSKNIKVRPVDVNRLLTGQCVPKHVARQCEWLFGNLRQEGFEI